MRNRILLMALYSVSLFTLASVVGLSVPAWLLLLIAAIPGVFRRIPPLLRFAIEVAVVTFMIVAVAKFWGVALIVIMAIAALSIARAQRPSADRAILGSVPIIVVASFINPRVTWVFLLLAAIAIVALVTSQDAEKQMEPQRLRLAMSIAVVAGLGAAAAGLIIHLMPWQTVLATTFSVIAYPFIAVFSRIHLSARPTTNRSLRSAFEAHHLPSKVVTHIPVILTSALVVGALIVLTLSLYAAYRYWARNEDNLDPVGSDRGIVREDLSDEVPDFYRPLRRRLKPVRTLVARRLRQSRHLQKERAPSETLREWMARSQPNVGDEVSKVYEDIRYGDADDTIAKRDQVRARWPHP
ncbi:MAG: hypothetical protein C7B45_02960 [Sulfobacillus acidophilus]|uniref:DUF4129 domain-containing protein n=1 Tax=Sulfobacillus acidophilus TaxID=53633 RepID=A0A2T2WMQ1_9FIRM|nr:MAG: hypothetical protein C7B45_02960 [Sulfobacillus acidophilus]